MTKKKRWRKVILCICIAVFLFFTAKYRQYDDYWEKAGKSYEDMLRLRGEPEYIEDDRGTCIVHYKEASYFYLNFDVKEPFLIEIRDEDIRFTPFRIGVGTQRDKIEKVYFLKDKEKAYVDEQTYGVVDGRVSIIFKFDKEEKVKKMCISSWDFGP